MANMLRSEMVTELQVRGHSRFTSAQLERYLDWALQDIYGMARFPRSGLTISTIAASVLDIIPFATISGAGAELVQQVRKVFVKWSTDLYELEAADEEYFMQVMWPNTLATNPVKAAKPEIYFVYKLGVYTYPKPQAAIDYHIHSLLREDVFSGPSDTTSLPERFDKAIIAQAEVHCNRRAHDSEGMALAMGEANRFFMEELGMAGAEMNEEQERVMPWGR